MVVYRAGLENDDDMWGINPLTRIVVRARPSYCSLCTAIHSTVALWGQNESEALLVGIHKRQSSIKSAPNRVTSSRQRFPISSFRGSLFHKQETGQEIRQSTI